MWSSSSQREGQIYVQAFRKHWPNTFLVATLGWGPGNCFPAIREPQNSRNSEETAQVGLQWASHPLVRSAHPLSETGTVLPLTRLTFPTKVYSKQYMFTVFIHMIISPNTQGTDKVTPFDSHENWGNFYKSSSVRCHHIFILSKI